MVGVGFGYKLSDNTRAEFSIQHRNYKYNNVKNSIDDIGIETSEATAQKTKNYTGFINGYYDFNNKSIFTPYVTAGIGISRNAAGNAIERVTLDGVGLPEKTYKGLTTNSFAYNAGLGSKVKLNESFDLDIAYKYVNLGKVKIANASNHYKAEKPLKLKAHEFTLGVVYNF